MRSPSPAHLPSPACSPSPARPPSPAPRLLSPTHQPSPAPQSEDEPPLLNADEETLQNEIYASVSWDDLQTALAFILRLQKASLDDAGTGLDEDAIDCIRNHPEHVMSLDGDEDLDVAIELYLKLNHTEGDYTTAREVFNKYKRQGVDVIPSIAQVKKIITEFTSIEHIMHNMCIDSCAAFTGPFAHLEHCPECGKPHYDQQRFRETNRHVKVPQKQFPMIPIGPQLQAIYCDPAGADSRRWLDLWMEEIFDKLTHNHGVKDTYSDFCDGSDYLEAVAGGKIKEGDPVLMMSIDGA